ncbi:hypothetical protein TNCV_4150841 [Trichonephila clavipes]|nr:hypothetical protein TNCV_4150841 [Trichonephila clavipes]
MASGSFMTPIYSRSQSEVQGDLHNLTEIMPVIYPSGYGHGFVVGVSRVRVLVSLKTRSVEGLMHDKSVEAWNPPLDLVWKLGERCQLRCCPRHLTMA